MIKFIGKGEPEPEDVILSNMDSAPLDYFDGMDRLAVVDRIEGLGKTWVINWGVYLSMLVTFVTAICWGINYFMGYPMDASDCIFICVAIPIISAINVRLGIGWVLDAYKKALQVAINE